jgi:sigma-B regulation protein RsbU (phosphoserine phosphatase)
VRASRQGLGLGLYIASQIAKAHGGELKVRSTAEETRFTFTMPAGV